MISRRGVVGGALGVPAILSAWSSVAGESAPVDGPPSLDELLKPSRVRSAALSPNGEKIALLALQDIDGKKIATVTFLKAADPSDGPKTIRIGSINVGGGDEVVLFGNKRIKLRENFDIAHLKTAFA